MAEEATVPAQDADYSDASVQAAVFDAAIRSAIDKAGQEINSHDAKVTTEGILGGFVDPIAEIIARHGKREYRRALLKNFPLAIREAVQAILDVRKAKAEEERKPDPKKVN